MFDKSVNPNITETGSDIYVKSARHIEWKRGGGDVFQPTDSVNSIDKLEC